MADDLVKRLRTCSIEERKGVAMELAHSGTNEAVTEFIRMVEGKRRYWLSWYDLNDSLTGIEALGESQNEGGLEYLKKLASYNTSGLREHVVAQWTGGTTITKGEEVDILFPHVPKKLRPQLPYSYVISGPEEQENPLQKNRVYQTIMSAIQKLEKNLQKASPNPKTDAAELHLVDGSPYRDEHGMER